jgi:hypothetical protein
MRYLAALILCVGLAAPAMATPPAQALFGTINGQAVAMYAGDSAFGLCIQGEAQQPGQPWVPVMTIECGITQATLDAQGGAKGYITYLLPDINLRLKAYFGGGSGVAAQLDEAFNVSFKYVGASLQPK